MPRLLYTLLHSAHSWLLLAMENIKHFLETSTIHGLTHISTTRKHARVFWIAVVVFGFTFSVYLIQQSFKAWDESPVTTTIETLPIANLTFPTVTVCPPRNTFTDLNHHLRMSDNMTLDNDIRKALSNYAVELLHGHFFEFNLARLNKMQQEHRYRNWYYGTSHIVLPFKKWKFPNNIFYSVVTSAMSGVMWTQYFGEKYDQDKVETDILYQVQLKPPADNLTLHFTMEKVAVKESDTDKESLLIQNKYINMGTKNISRTLKVPPKYTTIRLQRKIQIEEVLKIKLDLMPGFRLSWNFSGNVEPQQEHTLDSSCVGNELTCAFVRFANMLVISNHSLTDIWNILKEIKYTISVDKVCKNYLYENPEIQSIVTTFEETLNVKSSEIILGNMTDTTLKTAAEMFLYVNSCTYLLTPWLSFCKNLFENESPSTILLSLNRMLKVGDTRENRDLKTIVKKLFQKSNSLFSLKYGEVKGMSGTD